MEKIIEKTSIARWMEQLDAYEVYGPAAVKNEEPEVWDFRPIGNAAIPDLNYLNSTPSPKGVVFPQRQVMLRFSAKNNGNGREFFDVGDDGLESAGRPERVILGIRPCDAHAITYLDMVFGGDVDDPYYSKRRESLYLVGLGCNEPPNHNCFCTSVGGGPHDKTGLDVLMTDIGNGKYYLESLTPRGVKLMDAAGKLLKQAKTEERNTLREIHAKSAGKLNRTIADVQTVSETLKGNAMFESDIWEEESMACIRCGICTYLCPSCHCFDITDEIDSPAPLQGKRVRNWDNCQFPDFTMHSSGHNPRPGKASRLRRRILHKFRYFKDTHDHLLCSGCGRCVSGCPVGIDMIDILNRVGADKELRP